MRGASHKVSFSWLVIIGAVLLAVYCYSLPTKKLEAAKAVVATTISLRKKTSAPIKYDNQILPNNSGHLTLNDIVFTVKTGR